MTWATSNAAFSVTNGRSRNVHATFDEQTVVNLRPNTKYDLYVDNEPYGWAARPLGGRLGADLVTNEKGMLTFFMLREIPISGRVVVNNVVDDPIEGSDGSKRKRSVLGEATVVELRAPGSTFSTRIVETSVIRGNR